MGNLTKNISTHELVCKCGNPDCNVTILSSEPVIQIVQDACNHFAEKYKVKKVILIITSAGRCYVYNRIPTSKGGPGSNDNSQHPRARAIDFKILLPSGHQVSTKEVHRYLDDKYPQSLGLGLYDSFNHADTRPYKARW